MGNRRKIRMFVLLAICLILSCDIFESVWKASDPNPKPPFHEYVVHKSHQEAHMTEKGFAPSLYFLQTNKTVYMVTSDVYYQTNIGEEFSS